jgi:mevalonate kinase
MALGTGQAPGKVILFGEHAVVYGRPALAVPVTQVQASATVKPRCAGRGLLIHAPDLGETVTLADASHPLAAAARLAVAAWHTSEPDWEVSVTSTIPIASGLGSGAAVSAALIRAMAGAGGHRAEASALSQMVYEVDKLHHGQPSGVDNTVIAYQQPVYFVRGRPPQPFTIGRPFTLAIANSGIASPTRIAVSEVRRRWELEPDHYEGLFDRVAQIVESARLAIERGDVTALGPLMDANQRVLADMGVSCDALEVMVDAARSAGASGAKLSGAGLGGNLIALVNSASSESVRQALLRAGAVSVIITTVAATAEEQAHGSA